MASRRLLEDFGPLFTTATLPDGTTVYVPCTDAVAYFYVGGSVADPLTVYTNKDLNAGGATSHAFDAYGRPPANLFVATTTSVKVRIIGDGGNIDLTRDYYAQATDVVSNVFDTLGDPGVDRIAMWDESDNAADWLGLDTGLSISGTTLSLHQSIAALAGVTSAANKFPVYTGAGAAAVSGFDVFSGLLYGLTLSNNASDATNDIDVAAGIAIDGGNAAFMRLAASLTKRLDAAWQVGTGNGGLDTGAIANATYHVWLIMRSDTGTVDALFSLSASAPTMPANYDYKRRIGSIVRTGGAIRGFSQIGDTFIWTLPGAYDYSSGSNPGTSAISITLGTPTGIPAIAITTVILSDATPATATAVLVSELAATDVAPVNLTGPASIVTPASGAGVPQQVSGEFLVRTNTSAQIRVRLSGSDADRVFVVTTRGFIDTRGRT